MNSLREGLLKNIKQTDTDTRESYIESWLEKYTNLKKLFARVKYKINPDDSVSVSGGYLVIGHCNDKKIPIKFKTATMGITIHHCGFETLEGLPKKCKSFSISTTPIKNLKGAPGGARDGFYVHECDELVSLEGAPDWAGYFEVRNNPKLKTLKGIPETIGHHDSEWKVSATIKDNGRNFSEEEIRNLSNITGKVITR